MMNHIKIPPTAEEARVRIGPAEMAFTEYVVQVQMPSNGHSFPTLPWQLP